MTDFTVFDGGKQEESSTPPARIFDITYFNGENSQQTASAEGYLVSMAKFIAICENYTDVLLTPILAIPDDRIISVVARPLATVN